MRQRFAPKVAALEERIRRADQAVQREQDQATRRRHGHRDLARRHRAGRDLRSQEGASATSASCRAARRRPPARPAGRRRAARKETATALRQTLADLQAEFAQAVAELDTRMDPNLEELEPVTIRPRKTDMDVGLLALAFAPHWRDATGRLEPAWIA